MWGVFSRYLKIKGSNIIAMTGANFTSSTDPKNPASVYHGASSFTRCVWEVHLGNAVRVTSRFSPQRRAVSERNPQDVCVGDFWETAERRAISTFSTVIGVDHFLLVSMAQTSTSSELFKFMSQFQLSGCARARAPPAGPRPSRRPRLAPPFSPAPHRLLARARWR